MRNGDDDENLSIKEINAVESYGYELSRNLARKETSERVVNVSTLQIFERGLSPFMDDMRCVCTD